MVVIFGNLTNLFGGITNPGSSTVTNISSDSAFNGLVSKAALQFVYLGISILAASFLGVFIWTVTGERISRRIRG
jgi:hypothetical protein